MGQVLLTTLNPYTQNFNTLISAGSGPWVNNTTLPGWHLSAGTFQVVADDGSSPAGSLYSYGNTSSMDRALGSNSPTTFKLVMKNNTGGLIRHFKVRYRMEIWRKLTDQTMIMEFSYNQAPQIDPKPNAIGTKVASLQAEASSSSKRGALNGNVEFVDKEFLIQNVNLPAGHEIQFSWTTSNTTWGLAVDEVVVEPKNIIEFYNNNLTDLTSLSSWGTNRNGSSSMPEDLSQADQVFYITNYPPNASFVLPADWQMSSTGSKIVLGNGSTPITMQLPPDHVAGPCLIDVADYATLSVNSPKLPAFGSLGPHSTIQFGKEAPAEITGSSAFANLILDTGKKTRLAQHMNITGQLVLQDGQLELGDQDLELAYDATIQTGSSENYVVVNGKGRLRQGIRAGQELTLPVGNASYNPVKIKLAAGSQDDIFSMQVLDGVYGAYTNDVPDQHAALTGNTVNKTWIVDEDVKGGSEVTLTLSWSLTDALTGFNPADCHIKHYEYGAWDEYLSGAAASVVSLTATTFSISRPGITSFSPFTVSSSRQLTTLPVELLHFGAQPSPENTVELNWATAMEKNNDYFVIEASEDGLHFREVGRVQGAGDSHTVRHYHFIHRPNTAATTYYRLKQTDLDQTFTYSKVVAAAGQARPAARMMVSPNPSKDVFYLQAKEGSLVQASVNDVSGRQVLPAQPLHFSDGRYALDLSGRSAGVYLLHLATKNSRQVVRLVKS